MGNPIQYSSRTYNTTLNDINNDPDLADKPEWFKTLIAGLNDVINMNINATANQSFLDTAFTRYAVAQALKLIDYILGWKSTSSGTLLFYLNADSVIFPKTISVDDLIARSAGTTNVSSKRFEARAGVTATAISESFTTDYATDNNLDVARVYTTGEKVRVSSSGTLPTGLTADTDYYVIYISDTEIRLATTIANSYNSVEITLTGNGSGTHTISLYSVSVTAYQQEAKDDVNIGTSDGSTNFQKFDLPDLDVLSDTLSLTINSVSWTRVDSLIDSSSSDTHFVHHHNTDGTSFVMFGDGTYGAIPGNFDIFADYAIGGGIDSNIRNLNRITNYAGSDSDVVGVSNSTTFTGGSDAQNLEEAKILGPLLLKARDRFVTTTDGESLSIAYSGVQRAQVNKNVFGILSAQVLIVPSGGGLPSSGLKTALQAYLIDRTVLECVDVRVQDPTYISVSITSGIKVLDGYTFANIHDYIVLAYRLIFSEVTYEIVQTYEQDGIAAAISFINTQWSTSFTSADNGQIIRLLENVTPTDFNVSFQESDVVGFIDVFVSGVDYVTISSPSFPITVDIDEITTDNITPGNIVEIP